MKSNRPETILFLLVAFGALLAANPLFATDPFPSDTAYRHTYNASTVTLSGRVVNLSGTPLGNCSLSLSGGASNVTAANGTFILRGLWRSNQLLTVTAPGYYRHVMAVQLFVPMSQTNLLLPPVVLSPATPSSVRFLFGGDTAFARRMLDPLERAARNQMPVENPAALIQVTNPLPGTISALSFIKPLFLAADYPVVNFESVTTLDPSTPHWQKAFVYFTLPGSLPALRTLNIDYVGLGNNHVYDYLDSGVTNTRQYLTAAGLHFSGLGTNSAAAFVPYRKAIKGMPFSFLAMTSITGAQHETNYVAGPDKGGAADVASESESRAAIAAEKAAGNTAIVLTHIGDEYTYQPSAFALRWMHLVVDAGADVVVAHHPHVAQGFGMYKGVLLMHSLGNFCFDQDRLETMVGLLATVDMEGGQLRRAWGTPIYLEDYRPRALCGSVRSLALRRIAEFSQQVRVFPFNGQAWVASHPSQYSFTDHRVVIPVTIGTNGWTAFGTRSIATPEDSLSRIECDTPGLIVRPGRDLLYFGDFEDVDVDGEQGEASRWDFTTNTIVSLQKPYRGTACLSMYRKSTYADGVVYLRNRVRVMGDSRDTPNKDLSLIGYVRGQTAGSIRIVSHYYASEGTNDFGEEVPFQHPGGTFGWTPFVKDLHMPPDDPSRPGDQSEVNARSLRIFLHHSPPATGDGYANFDELAIVNWEESLDPLTGPVLATPHARDFFRVTGPPGTYQLALTFRSYRPTEADKGHGPSLGLETERPEQSIDRFWFRPTSVGFQDMLRLVVWNRGNQALVVSNLTFVSGNTNQFLARWLGANGSSGPVTTIAPQTAARLEARFVPSSAGSNQAVLQFQSNDPDQSRVSLVVGGNSYTAVPVRFISNNRTESPAIHIQVPPTAAANNQLLEQLPAGTVPIDISGGGSWDPASRTLQWQDVPPGTSVSYLITGNGSSGTLTGRMVAQGPSINTVGDSASVILAPPDADGDGLPDWWEQKFFDSRTAAVPEVDSDNDGQSNLAEFLAGTHPLDGGFQAQSDAPYLRHLVSPGGFAEFQVLGFDGVTYRLQESIDLQTWTAISTNLSSGDPVVMPWKVPPGSGPRFYRAAVETQ